MNEFLYIYIYIHMYIRRKFRSETSDSMDIYGQFEKQRWEESERRRKEVRRSERRKRGKKEDARKGRKVASHCVFFQ